MGAIRPALERSKEARFAQSLLFIADVHALNTHPDPKSLQERVLHVSAAWLALGLDPKQTVFFKQSDIPEIFEVTSLLMSFTPKGLLNRAHAYKAAVDLESEDPDRHINMGLFTYPVLMAADILALGGTHVPVGEDQLQHLEIARDIAQKVNSQTKSKVLFLPEPLVEKGLQTLNGTDGRKMSKSYENVIPIFAPESEVRKTFMRIKTDSSPPDSPKDPDQSLVFEIHKAIVNSPHREKEIRERYVSGISWGDAKKWACEEFLEIFKRPREDYNQFIKDRGAILSELTDGAKRAREISTPILSELKRKVGLI